MNNTYGDIFMSDYISLQKRLYAEDGGELLRYSITFPTLDGKQDETKKINEFYATVAKHCESFCHGELLAFCKENRRGEGLYRPYSYRLDCTVSLEDGECVAVMLSASLKRLGESTLVGEYTAAQVFSKADGLLLPPALILKKYAPEIKNLKKYIRKNKLVSLCPTEQGVVTKKDGKWKLLT